MYVATRRRFHDRCLEGAVFEENCGRMLQGGRGVVLFLDAVAVGIDCA
jgi:hypothetical protein